MSIYHAGHETSLSGRKNRALPAFRRILSLGVVVLFIIAAALSMTPLPGQQKPASNDREKLARRPKSTATLSDRLGKDDGYGAMLFLSADIGGNLEVCGCPIHPLGSVPRRMGYINAQRRRSDGAGVIMVDAGHGFSDELNQDKTALREDAALMNDWILRANESVALDVVNLSHRDLGYMGAKGLPGAGPTSYLSANIKGMKAGNPAPWVIKTITGKRLPRPVTIAFIGVSQTAPDEQKPALDAAGLSIGDPVEAVRQALAEVRDKADLIAVAGYFRFPFANRLAMQVPGLDLILGADGSGLVPDPKQVGDALVMFAANQTKHLAELRMYTDAQGVVQRFTTRYVELDEAIPDDPAMAEMTRQARREIDVVQRRVAEQIAASYKPDPNQPVPFAGSESCAECHQRATEIWKNSRHARAFAALETKQREFDDSCVGCHSVGFKNQGFVNIKATPQFANVQCESCHGPGAGHVKSPATVSYKTPAPPTSCMVCHDPENSPDFVFARYWPLVAHGKSVAPPGKGRKRK
ncbi:MAG: multiheme c-type cytochrome [Blastocatellia bacterium]